ncbi:MAG: vitamin B12 transporter [Saprospiraceae bacterium]
MQIILKPPNSNYLSICNTVRVAVGYWFLNMFNSKGFSSSVIALLLAQSSTGFAQDNTLDELVISANLTPISAERIGSAVTIINEATLRDSNATHIADVLRLTPGVHVTRASNKGSLTAIRMRGAEANHVLVRIDGIEVNNATGTGAFLSGLVVSDIERIEIIRGPQSALTGSDALAGVINIYTYNGKGAQGTTVGLEVGSDNTQQLTLHTQGSDNGSHHKIAIEMNKSDGFSVASSGTEDDGFDNTTAAFSYGKALNSTTQIETSLRISESSLDVDGTSFDFTSPTYGQTIDLPDEQDDKELFAHVKLKKQHASFDSTFNLAVSDSENKFDSASFGKSTTNGKKTKLSWQGDWSANQDSGFSMLLEAENNEYEQRGATATSLSNQSQDTTDYSAAVEYRYASQGGLFGSASIRQDSNDAFDDSTTFRLTSAYLTAGGKVHGSVGSAVTNPSFVETFGFFPSSFIGNPDLQPEESLGFDVGYEHRFANDAVVMDITYFQANLENEITTVFNPDFTSTVKNLDKDSERSGIEVAVTASLSESTQLTAAFTNTDSENGKGKAEIRRPENVASLSLTNKSMGNRLTSRIDLSHSSSRLDTDFANGVNVTLASYTLVDANLTYQLNDRVALNARVENAFDEEYENVFGFSTPGRKWLFGVSAKF